TLDRAAAIDERRADQHAVLEVERRAPVDGDRLGDLEQGDAVLRNGERHPRNAAVGREAHETVDVHRLAADVDRAAGDRAGRRVAPRADDQVLRAESRVGVLVQYRLPPELADRRRAAYR